MTASQPRSYVLERFMQCQYCGSPMLVDLGELPNADVYRCSRSNNTGASCASPDIRALLFETRLIQELTEAVMTPQNMRHLQCHPRQHGRILVKHRLRNHHRSGERPAYLHCERLPGIRQPRLEQLRPQDHSLGHRRRDSLRHSPPPGQSATGGDRTDGHHAGRSPYLIRHHVLNQFGGASAPPMSLDCRFFKPVWIFLIRRQDQAGQILHSFQPS